MRCGRYLRATISKFSSSAALTSVARVVSVPCRMGSITKDRGKAVRVVLALVLIYVGIVVAFESMLGIFQPAGGDTLVIATTSDDEVHSRVVSGLEVDGQLYVAANHWPRAWYRQALANPNIEVTRDGATAAYLAVAVDEDEHERVDSAHRLGPVIRFLTGFPPRRFVRLDPS